MVDGSDYENQSTALRAALLSDEQTELNTALEDAQEALADAQADVAAVDGLEAAAAALETAEAAAEDAADALDDADTQVALANAAFAILSDGTVNITAINNDGNLTDDVVTIDLDADNPDAVSITVIEYNAEEEVFVLAEDITEDDFPGVTALLNAINDKQDAMAAKDDADAAVVAAQQVVDDLDLSEDAVASLAAVGAEFTLTEVADEDAPTRAEIEAELDALVDAVETAAAASELDISVLDLSDAADIDTLVNNATTAVADASNDLEALAFVAAAGNDLTEAEITTAETALATGIADLKAAIEAVTFDAGDATTLSAVEVLVGQAETGGFISADDNEAIIAVFGDYEGFSDPQALAAALTAASAAVDTNNETDEFQELVSAYEAAITTLDAADALNTFADLVDTYNTDAADNPLLTILEAAESDVEAAQDAVDALAEAVTDLADAEADVDAAQAVVDAREDLVDAVDAALAAIENPVDDEDAPGLGIDLLDSSDAVADVVTFTEGDDLFVYSADSDDLFFADFGTEGMDQIFVGTDFTLFVAGEEDEIADNLGSVSALEIIVIDDGTDTTLYFEGETFAGNSAGTADIDATITLTGVTGAEFSIDADGFLSIA